MTGRSQAFFAEATFMQPAVAETGFCSRCTHLLAEGSSVIGPAVQPGTVTDRQLDAFWMRTSDWSTRKRSTGPSIDRSYARASGGTGSVNRTRPSPASRSTLEDGIEKAFLALTLARAVTDREGMSTRNLPLSWVVKHRASGA